MKNVEHINIVVQNSCPANIFRLKIRNINKRICLKKFFNLMNLFDSKKKKKKKIKGQPLGVGEKLSFFKVGLWGWLDHPQQFFLPIFFFNNFFILCGIKTLSITCDTWATCDGNLSWTKYVERRTCVNILRG